MNYVDRELEKIEKQQRELRTRQDSEDKDRYNTLEPTTNDNNLYMRIVNAKINLAPSTGETLEDYIKKILIYQEIAKTKNWNTHVDNPYKTWRTHKIPVGCFMCEDMAFIGVLIQVLQVLNHNNKSLKF